MKLTPEQREELKRLEAAATPGPWEKTGWGGSPGDEGWWINGIQPLGAIAVALPYNPCGDADAAFIAASRSAVPSLMADLERVEQERDEVLELLRFVPFTEYVHWERTGDRVSAQEVSSWTERRLALFTGRAAAPGSSPLAKQEGDRE